MRRELEHVGIAVAFAKGAWDTGKTILAAGQAIAPYVMRAATLL